MSCVFEKTDLIKRQNTFVSPLRFSRSEYTNTTIQLPHASLRACASH